MSRAPGPSSPPTVRACGHLRASGGWPSHKQSVDSFVLARLEQILPGIGAHIAVCTSASARTSWRFTLNHQGAMLGWEMSPEQVGDGRPDLIAPLAGLYTVGHWTRPGGGITPVIVSAQRAARLASGARALAGAGAAAGWVTIRDHGGREAGAASHEAWQATPPARETGVSF